MPASGYRHLSIEDRKTIESLLNISDVSLKQIALSIGYSPKCVRQEITRHRSIRTRANQRNRCGRQIVCEQQRLCTHCQFGLCKYCTHDNCNELCEEFIQTPVCPRTERFQFVCSGCKKIEKCKLPKYFYIAAHAQADYENAKREWRTGPRKTSTEMKQISEVLREGIKRKQSVDAIIQANSLPIATSTAYRYIANHNISGISNIDLKRQVRYSPRGSSKPQPVPMDYDYLDGRRYEDFLLRLETAESDENIWEMDTIIGKRERDEHCVLSLLHRRSNLQLYFLLPRKEMLAVNRVYDSIKAFLGPDLFKDAFSIILTDNGSEFHDPQSLETWAVDGRKLINIYYARPRRSDDKGKCEKNHEHFREKVPKGFSMNQLTQKDINFISNQVNNYVRKKLNYHSPYEIARMVLIEKVLDLNRLHFINPNLVDLTPILR